MDTLGLLSTKAAAGQVKVIALTGNPSKSIIEKAKSARVSAVLTKPFSPAQLVDRITSLAS
jgi:CheY-like chemotaxis protein